MYIKKYMQNYAPTVFEMKIYKESVKHVCNESDFK